MTYKTELTKIGIWALTVGIVDPGWNGPIATTLLNFGRNDYAVALGDTFLRVTFFEHAAVPKECLELCDSVDNYLQSVRKTAMTRFPQTFLNKEEIANNAGDAVLKQIRTEALVWIAAISITFSVLFGAIQLVSNYLRASPSSEASEDLRSMRTQIDKLEARVAKYEMMRTLPPPDVTTPTVGPNKGP